MVDTITTHLTAVVLTALTIEFQAAKEHLHDIDEEIHPEGTIYTRGTFPTTRGNWKIALVQIGAGNLGAAFEAERAIHYFRPQVALFIGVAGGLKVKDVRLGDVVAATKAYGYESGKAGETFQARPEVGNVTYAMEQRARAEASKDNWKQRITHSRTDCLPKVLIGPIAAGEKVLKSRNSPLVAFLQNTYEDALTVEMEGYGFLKATHANHQVDSLIVRGVSDLIEGKDETDKHNWQEIAACHASAFAFEVLAKSTPYEQARRDQANNKDAQQHPTTQPGNYHVQFHGTVHNVAVGDNTKIINS